MSSIKMKKERKPHAAKVGHHKSRNGCLVCKQRRVKCDEEKPTCNHCGRLGFQCEWPVSLPRRLGGASQASSPGQGSVSSPGFGFGPTSDPSSHAKDNPHDDIPESRSRRLLEHRLMQNYYLIILDQFPAPTPPSWREIFHKTIPTLALEHDNLFYQVLALSATNILSREPENREVFRARQAYLVSAVHEQRVMIESMCVENAEAISLAALLILTNAFAMLQERTMEPYTAPTEWLHMGKGAGMVLRTTIGFLLEHGDRTSTLVNMATSPPHLTLDESYFDPSMRIEFKGVLDQTIKSGDTWDDETREAYEKTLSYVGSIVKSVRDEEPVYVVARRIQAFPMMMPRKFLDFLVEQRPRALVILAHYFAAASQTSWIWWLGGTSEGTELTARGEVRAIGNVLPEEWLPYMTWPSQFVGLL